MIRLEMKANRFYWIFYWIICSLLSDPIIFGEWVRKQRMITRGLSFLELCGAYETRTRHLLTASQTL